MSDVTHSQPARAGGGLRWLAAEFVVVALGVLAALGADAFREDRVEEQREAVYLTQFVADLTETEDLIRRYQNDSSVPKAATATLVQTFRLLETPTADSLYKLIGGLVSWPGSIRPVLGTVEAMVASGDLTLIRDDSLRIAITKYHEAARGHIQASQNDFEMFRTPGKELFTGVDVVEGLYRFDPDSELWATGEVGLRMLPPEPELEPFELVPEEFFSSREMYYSVLLPAFALLNDNIRLLTMLEEAQAMRESVERYLGSQRSQ